MMQQEANEMDSEQRFWLRVWALPAGILALAIVGTLATCEVSHHREMAALEMMVESGASPLEAQCALSLRSKPTYASLACVALRGQPR